MDPFSRDETYTRWLTPKMWAEIKASPVAVADMLDDLKHGNTYYTGVETDKGVLLFSRDYMGNHQYEAFMEANIERRFFEPDFEGRSLTVYELRGWPSLMAGKINRCYDNYDDLSPTWENYARLTDNEKGLGLARSVDNYDCMTLLYIMDKGYPRDGLTDEYPDNFSFHEKFERIENKLLGRDRWDVYDEMQEKAKKLAGKLLYEHFPDTRLKEDAIPKMKVEKEIPKKSKGRKM